MGIINKDRDKKFPNNTDFNLKFAPVTISVKNLNSMIFNNGASVKVFRSLPCPNRKSIDGGEHEVNCPLCGGVELIDLDPVDTFALITGIHSQEQFNPENIGSAWQEQTITMTFISTVELLYFAKIELNDYSMPFYETIQRQEGELDLTKYPVVSVNAIIDQNGIRYYPGTDFSFDSSRNIKWNVSGKSNVPARGIVYSIHYNTYVVFRALSAIHSNRFTTDGIKKAKIENIEYNQQWLCKKDYLITREDINGHVLTPNKILPEGQ